MLSKDILTERITVPDEVDNKVRDFMLRFFNQMSTAVISNHEGVKVKVPVYRNMSDISIFVNQLSNFGLVPLIITICKQYFKLDDDIEVLLNDKCYHSASSVSIMSRSNQHNFHLLIHNDSFTGLFKLYTNYLIFEIERFQNAARKLIDRDRYGPEEGENFIAVKNNYLENYINGFSAIPDFIALLIHEITHIKTESSAFSSYKNKGTYEIETSKAYLPHRAAQDRKHDKLRKNLYGFGLNSHFGDPHELESYAQEIAYKIRKDLGKTKGLPLTIDPTVYRKNVMRHISHHREEIKDRSKHLTTTQQKYINKLYKRIFQEIADALYNNRPIQGKK